jgi:exonuclease VII large subunit
MTAPRRRILRSVASPPAALDLRTQHRHQRLRTRLAQEQAGLTRWMARLKRAFHAVERHQERVGRLERQLDSHEPG